MNEKYSQESDHLISLLSGKIKAFEDYYAATILLDQALAEKDIIKIGTIINLRANNIEHITSIDREIQKVSSGNLPHAESQDKKVHDLLAKLEEVIRKTQNDDNSCIGSATALFKETSEETRMISKGLNTFTKKQFQESRFLNIRT